MIVTITRICIFNVSLIFVRKLNYQLLWEVCVAEVDEADSRERVHHFIGRDHRVGLIQLIVCVIQRQR